MTGTDWFLYLVNVSAWTGLIATAMILWSLRHKRNGLFIYFLCQLISVSLLLLMDLDIVTDMLTADEHALYRRCGRLIISIGACYLLGSLVWQRQPPA